MQRIAVLQLIVFVYDAACSPAAAAEPAAAAAAAASPAMPTLSHVRELGAVQSPPNHLQVPFGATCFPRYSQTMTCDYSHRYILCQVGPQCVTLEPLSLAWHAVDTGVPEAAAAAALLAAAAASPAAAAAAAANEHGSG